MKWLSFFFLIICWKELTLDFIKWINNSIKNWFNQGHTFKRKSNYTFYGCLNLLQSRATKKSKFIDEIIVAFLIESKIERHYHRLLLRKKELLFPLNPSIFGKLIRQLMSVIFDISWNNTWDSSLLWEIACFSKIRIKIISRINKIDKNWVNILHFINI